MNVIYISLIVVCLVLIVAVLLVSRSRMAGLKAINEACEERAKELEEQLNTSAAEVASLREQAASAKTKAEQEHLFRVLVEMDKYKNN